MRLRTLISLLCLVPFAASLLSAAAPTSSPRKPSAPPQPPPAPPTLTSGEIQGARFAIAHPTRWNGSLLLLAHGLRDDTAPLVADLNPDHLAYRTLRDEGWMIAKTSYRRNGVIIADALADLDNLRAHVAATYGTPRRVLVEGDSLGGLLATLIAERPPGDFPLYHGCVAVGAALSTREPGGTLGLNFGTQLPLIFLTNRSELTGPKNYVVPPAELPREHRSHTPVIFRVARDGHVNVNQHERLAALRALNAWLDLGPSSLPAPADGTDFFDATHEPAPQPSQVLFDADRRGFTARVTEVTAVYGNVALNAQPADFASAGIEPNAWFKVTAHDQTRRVLLGAGFSAVKRGEWVAFPNADGFFWLARNFENAAKTATLKVGDEVHVQSYSRPPPLEKDSSP